MGALFEMLGASGWQISVYRLIPLGKNYVMTPTPSASKGQSILLSNLCLIGMPIAYWPLTLLKFNAVARILQLDLKLPGSPPIAHPAGPLLEWKRDIPRHTSKRLDGFLQGKLVLAQAGVIAVEQCRGDELLRRPTPPLLKGVALLVLVGIALLSHNDEVGGCPGI